MKKYDLFFAWCDGYVASAEGNVVDVAFTLYSTERNLEPKVIGVSIPQNEIVSVSHYGFDLADAKYKGYKAYGVILTMEFEKTGEFSFDTLTIEYANGEKKEYPVGDWTLESGAKASSKVYTWESPAVSTSSETILCSYDIEDPAVTSCTIYTGFGEPVEVKPEGQKIAEELELNGSDAPMKYVRPKITFTANGGEYVSYGMGCYCGAANFTKKEIELSYQHNAQAE